MAPEVVAKKQIVANAGGMVNAYEELRELNRILPDLAWHVSAKFLQRADLKVRQLNLKWYELLFMLDYGGFTDSRGGKISVWSCTVFAPRPRKQEHFDFFFDASNAGKNGQTGIYFLGELLDGTLYPEIPGRTTFNSIWRHRKRIERTR